MVATVAVAVFKITTGIHGWQWARAGSVLSHDDHAVVVVHHQDQLSWTASIGGAGRGAGRWSPPVEQAAPTETGSRECLGTPSGARRHGQTVDMLAEDSGTIISAPQAVGGRRRACPHHKAAGKGLEVQHKEALEPAAVGWWRRKS